jgi:antitoxin (DNA-binding transcriptional repressor) of toxin-antitoxin stability system
MTQRLPTAVARKDFANVLRDSAAGERIKLTRYNKTVAVIIPKKDLTDLEDCQRLHGPGAPSGEPETEKPARAHAQPTKDQTKDHKRAQKKSDK